VPAGRILRIAGGIYDVDTDEGLVQASLRGRVKKRDARIVSVGDLVDLEPVDDDGMRIARVHPRESALTRHGVARRREQVIVANVDQVAVVAALAAPDPDWRMIDRLLALADLNELDRVLVMNKADEGPPDAHAPEDRESAPLGPLLTYADLGIDLLFTSAKLSLGLDELAHRLAGRITVFTGQSGVGKSSLLNALMPGLDLRVGEVGERKGRGRHTTVASALYPYPDGGYVADTPGLQYLALWDVAPTDLGLGFPEIREARDGCRFNDCLHRTEPGCAVREAVEAGEITGRRYESYLGLLTETEEKATRTPGASS
jgi:ribosome biogenesis GTPase